MTTICEKNLNITSFLKPKLIQSNRKDKCFMHYFFSALGKMTIQSHFKNYIPP